MLFTYTELQGDVPVSIRVPIEVGDEFNEGAARYRVNGFKENPAGHRFVACRIISGIHPFWVTPLRRGDDVILDEETAARLFYEKRAFLQATGDIPDNEGAGPIIDYGEEPHTRQTSRP
jgi:hypothetical protein